MRNVTRILAVAAVLAAGVVTASWAAGAVTPEAREEAKKHFSFAVQNKNSGNNEEALRQYMKSIELDPTVYQVRYGYADLLMKLDQPKDAKGEFVKVLELKPDHFNSALMLSRIYKDEGDYENTLAMYELMYGLKPDNASIVAGVAGLRKYLGDDRGALEAYKTLVSMGEDSYDTIMEVCRLALTLGDNPTAHEYAVMALGKTPDSIEALKVAAKTALAAGDTPAGAGFLRRLAEAAPEDMGVVTQLEGIYRAQEDSDSLLWALGRHHELAPKNVDVMAEYSKLLFSTGRIEESLAIARKGIDIDKKNGQFRILIGEHYRAAGNEDKALEQYRMALDDNRWKTIAQRFINQIEKPETEGERLEREFFSRGRTASN